MDWWKDTNKPDQEFLDRMSIEFNKIDNLFAEDYGEKEIEGKSKIAEGLIKHYLDLTKVLDQRRGDYYKAALQLVAIGLTGLGLLLKFITSSPTSFILLIGISICLGLVAIIITAFCVIKVFYWQTKSERYHFLKIDTSKIPNLGNSWEWFYHGVKGISNIPFTSFSLRKKEKDRHDQLGVEGYITGASFYFDNFIKSTPKDLYIENLKHAYLLLVHNAYKNKFERQLTNVMSRGINITLWIVTISIIISILITCFSSNIPIISKDKSATSVNMNFSKYYTPSNELKPQASQVKIDSIKNAKKDPIKKNKTDNTIEKQ